MWGLVGNPEDRFSHNEAQIYVMVLERMDDMINDMIMYVVCVFFAKERL